MPLRSLALQAKGMLVAKSRKPLAEVFLNIPYDKKFDRLFLAYISGTCAFGLVPRATLEIPSGASRLDRILGLIESCQYSAHDLSRAELDVQTPQTPRFNMPFELGLSVAHAKGSKKRNHQWFVCESKALRLAKSLSDLNGVDPYVHGGTIAGVFRELCNMFIRRSRQPSIQQMWKIYRELRKRLPLILHQAGAQSLYTARVFSDLCVIASRTADRFVQ
jgi:hypothetical protein